MNKFKDKILSYDKTKRRVICFIILSFCFIFIYPIVNNSHIVITSTINEIEGTSTVLQPSIYREGKTQKAKENKKTTNKQDTKKETSNKTTKSTSSKTNKTTKKTNSTKKKTNNKTNKTTKKSTTKKKTISQDTTEYINVKVTIRGMGNIMYSGTIKEEKGNSSAYSAMVKLVNSKGSSVSGSSSYVTGIGGLKEKQHGPLSGWMYSVNGKTPMKSAGSYKLSDGDNLLWYYVNYE